jgi:adenine-specific DNA-methyltransferase
MKIYNIDDHKIIQGDVLEVLKSKEIPDNSIDLIFADPPYNIGKEFNGNVEKWTSDDDYISWCKQWINLALKKLKPNGSLYIMTATQFMPYIDIYLSRRMHVISRIIWYYDSSGVQATKAFGSLYEPILHCVKSKNKYVFNGKSILIDTKTGAKRKLIDYRKDPPKKYNSKKVPGNVWVFSRVRYRMAEYEHHPTQKPRHLMERIVKVSSNRKHTVLDLFAGSFTTGETAKLLGRKSINIEKEPEYIKIGLRRVLGMQKLNGEELLKKKKPYVRKNGVNKK